MCVYCRAGIFPRPTPLEVTMRWFILLLLPLAAFAQPFQFTEEWDSVQVQIGDYTLPAPWTGGYSYSCPDFCDIDGDGDLDAFLGSFSGKIAYWENLGTAQQASFHFQFESYQSLFRGAYSRPEFWDIDADGDLDLFIAYYIDPRITVFKNLGNSTNPSFEFVTDTLRDVDGNRIYCQRAALADLDGDGDKDLLCGEYGGFLYYYENIGTSSQYQFRHVGGNYYNINVGYAASPAFCDIDADGDDDLFIGDSYGCIHYYLNEGTPQVANFVLVSNTWLNIDVGDYASPEFCDIDGDGDYDLYVGRDVSGLGLTNLPGDVYFYENTGTPQVPQYQLLRKNNLTIDVGVSARPLIIDFNSDGKLDLLISNNDYLLYYSNIGTNAQPAFSLISENYLNDTPPYSMALYDLNGDSKLDMITANGYLFNGQIKYYRNIGTSQNPVFRYVWTLQTPFTLGTVTIADIDNDGDGDMLLGKFGGGLAYYANTGTAQNPNFLLQSENWQNIPQGRNPCFVDFDRDGTFDLLTGYNDSGYVELWHNVGTPQNPSLILSESNLCGMQFYGPLPTAADIDDDGDTDVFIGEDYGGCRFFRNVTGQSPVDPHKERYHPQAKLSLVVGPQPGNPATGISFTLPSPQNAEVAVYNLLGAKIATLVSGWQPAGTKSLVWNAFDRASGVYIVTLSAAQGQAAAKVVVVK
jgi:hypothetical protein